MNDLLRAVERGLLKEGRRLRSARNIYINTELWERLDVYCRKYSKSKSRVIEALVELLLEDEARAKKNPDAKGAQED